MLIELEIDNLNEIIKKNETVKILSGRGNLRNDERRSRYTSYIK